MTQKKKRIFSKLMMVPAICMMMSSSVVSKDGKVSTVDRVEKTAAADNSINGVGTFHDNSWDVVPLNIIGSTKDDSKKNLLHDYKVVKGKVKDTVTGKVVKGLTVCKDAPKYFVGDNTTRIPLHGNWDEYYVATHVHRNRHHS